jgi:hypothetical protein
MSGKPNLSGLCLVPCHNPENVGGIFWQEGVMSLEALGVTHAALKPSEWILAVVAIATIAVIAWEAWETIQGNDRPVLRITVGIMLSFLAVMGVERGLGRFRSGTSNYRGISDVLMGRASLAMSIHYIKRRNAKTRPRGIVEWLHERDKPPADVRQKRRLT